MNRDDTVTKNEKVVLSLKILMFIIPDSTQEEVTKIINQTWDTAPCCLDSWALAVPDACICC